MNKYTKEQKDRLGNTVVYIADKVEKLSKTKLLKLLYLLEETTIQKHQRPFLGLDFEVWKYGPVVKEVYAGISYEANALSEYVNALYSFNNYGNIETTITPAGIFSDDEFSDNDIEIMDSVIKKFGHMTAAALVKETHKKDGLWLKHVEESGLQESFDNGQTTSSVVMDLSGLLEGCEKAFYLEQMELEQLIGYLKN